MTSTVMNQSTFFIDGIVCCVQISQATTLTLTIIGDFVKPENCALVLEVDQKSN